MKVPFSGLDLQYQRLKPEIDAAVSRVLESGWYVGGPEVEKFEQGFAAFTGSAQAIGVANGTDAIALALRACGVGRGDEVIIPALSAYPTTVGVLQAEAVPVFADVRLEDGLIDSRRAEEAITSRTRAIVPVHLYGSCADLAALSRIAQQRGLALVEDCAQAHGAARDGHPAGTVGTAAAWSFYPTKNLGAVGDSGAVTTNDAPLAEKLKRLRNYGQRNRYEHVERGFNSRLDPLQAAILAVKLRVLPADNERRRALAAQYDAGLAGLSLLRPLAPAQGSIAARHLYAVLLAQPVRREAFQDFLRERGVETLIHYPIAMPDQAATDPAWRRHDHYPNARALCAGVVSLPLHPELTAAQVTHAIETVRAWAAQVLER